MFCAVGHKRSSMQSVVCPQQSLDARRPKWVLQTRISFQRKVCYLQLQMESCHLDKHIGSSTIQYGPLTICTKGEWLGNHIQGVLLVHTVRQCSCAASDALLIPPSHLKKNPWCWMLRFSKTAFTPNLLKDCWQSCWARCVVGSWSKRRDKLE